MKNRIVAGLCALVFAIVASVSCTLLPGNDYYKPSFPKQEKAAEIPSEGGLCYFLVKYDLDKADDAESKYDPEIVWKSFRYRIDINGNIGDERIVNTIWEIPVWPIGVKNPGNESEFLFPVPFVMPANDDYADNDIKVDASVDQIYTNSALAHQWGEWELVYTGIQAGKAIAE